MSFLQIRRDPISRLIHRVAVGLLFFLQGICFASWASRIPTIQRDLDFSDAQLGFILLALPAGLMLSLPISGWLIIRIGSKKMVLVALTVYALALISIGLANSMITLMGILFLYGLSGNMVNISVNTQAIAVESLYGRPIMASFHGLWSLAGFLGAAIGSFMMATNIIPFQHFLYIASVTIVLVVLSSRFIIKDQVSSTDNNGFVMPDKALLHLGFITFCGMICEGAMFDWSGIYFLKVVQPEKEWLGAGYTSVMLTMASGRFLADSFAHRFGLKTTLQLSGILIVCGLLLVVILPQLSTAIAGFLLVGFGISSIVPLVYSQAGRSRTMSPGVAIAAVSTIGFLGFLIGPPFIGLLAGLFNLRISFVFIAIMGLSVTVLSSFIKKEDPVKVI